MKYFIPLRSLYLAWEKVPADRNSDKKNSKGNEIERKSPFPWCEAKPENRQKSPIEKTISSHGRFQEFLKMFESKLLEKCPRRDTVLTCRLTSYESKHKNMAVAANHSQQLPI